MDMVRILEGRDSSEWKDITSGFLESVPAAVLVLDKEWRLVYLNKEAEKFFAGDPSSLMGRPLEEVYPREIGHMLAPKEIRGIMTGSIITKPRFVARFGRWYKLFAYSSGSLVFVRLEDVTLEVNAQRMLRLSQFSIEHSADMVFWIKPSGHIIYANEAAHESLGFEKYELARMMILDIDLAFTWGRWAKFVEDMRRKESMTFESSLRTANRTSIPVEVTLSYFVYFGEEYVMASARDIAKRKQADNSLRVSEEKFRALTETSNAMVLFHQGGKHLYVNPAVERITGYSRDELLNMNFWEFIAPEDQKKVRDRGMARLSGKKPTPNYQVKILTKQGEERWIEITSARMMYQNLPGIMVTALDITERKRAEQALRESEERYRQISESLPQLVWTCRADGPCDYLSPQWVKYTGIPEDAQLGYRWLNQLHPDDRDRVEREWASTAFRGVQFNIEFRIRRYDGVYRWFKTRAIPLHDTMGNLVKWFGSNMDIDDLKQAEMKIAHLASFPELNPNPIFEVGTDGIVGFINPATKKMFPDLKALGVDHPMLRGFDQIVDNLRDSKSYFMRDIKCGDCYFQQTIYVGPDKNYIRFYNLNITERKQAEEALNEEKTRAELYLDLMGHDINNMHQVALGYLELAKEMPDSGVHAEFLDKSVEVLQRSTALISNVRKLQKLQDGVFKTQDMELSQLLAEVQKEYGSVPHKRITLKLNGHEHCKVRANELLHDVFANLVINAIKHTGDKADILLVLDTMKDDNKRYCMVIVEDNGPGIPDESKERIFNRTLKGTNKARGMGLGLYLVKSLVDSYGGKVWVEDRVKEDHTKGARFVVMLPAVMR